MPIVSVHIRTFQCCFDRRSFYKMERFGQPRFLRCLQLRPNTVTPACTVRQHGKGRSFAFLPQGRLYIYGLTDRAGVSESSQPTETHSILAREFQITSGRGLIALAKKELPVGWPAGFAFFKEFCRRFGESLCGLDEVGRERFGMKLSQEKLQQLVPPPDALELSIIISQAPPIRGLEYLTTEVLTDLWLDLMSEVHRHVQAGQYGLGSMPEGS